MAFKWYVVHTYSGFENKVKASLLERIELDGAGLDVQGSGGRTLTGGLAFRGRAQVADAARLRSSASGVLSADWRAGQARGGRPWSFSFEADGRRFASGWGQLDRLLGPAPRLVAAGALFIHQQWLIRHRQRQACFEAFLNNNWVGMVIFAGVALHYATR